MAHHRLLLLRRPGRRQLLRRHHDARVREEPGSPDGPCRLSGLFPPRLPLRAPAHGGPRAAGALLAHADPVRDAPADDQDVFSDVERRVGAPALQRVRLSLLPRCPRRGGLAGLADPSAAGPDRTAGPATHGDRSPARPLSRRLHWRAALRHESTHLGGYILSWTDLPCLGGVHLRGASHPPWLLDRGVATQRTFARALRPFGSYP